MPDARQLLKKTAHLVDGIKRPARGVTVLIYHRVGRRSSVEVDLPTALFDEQMAELTATRPVITLDDALDRLARPTPPAAPDPVVVTFDDGTADFVDEAMPVLERHQVPVTLYVATDFIEQQRPFPDDGRPLTWAGLRDAADTGLVTVGSHTHTHALLDRLDRGAVADELDRSRGLIADRLELEPRHFAYPKAVPGSTEADAEVRRRFASAALARTRPNAYGAGDPYRLWRSPIQLSDGMTSFRHKADGGLWAEDAARRLANRVRYRGKTS